MSEDRKKLNVTFEPLSEADLERLKSSFPSYRDGMVKGNPGGFVISAPFGTRAEDLYNFEVREDDTWVVTFPKSGTTWTQELVWLVSNNCDFDKANSKPLELRFPFLEMSLMPPEEVAKWFVSGFKAPSEHDGAESEDFIIPFDKVALLPSPRFIKSHLPFYLLPPGLLDTAKVIYVARNPKDVIVSFYYHHKLFKPTDIPISIEQFAEHFMNDETMCSPFFAHVLEAWNKRNHPNLLFIFYEDMKKDLAGQIRKVASFLNKDLTEENVSQLVEHLSFSKFSQNKSVNMERSREIGLFSDGHKFVRKGITGDWKNHFSGELNERLDAWIEKNLAGTDLKFVTELEEQ